jgi:hypothetical protein
MKSITGQYECSHHSGIGLDYFTSRFDRLTLQANGHFVFVVQEQSRIGHAAKSLLNGQQVDTNAPEVRREGRYSYKGNSISFFFDDGTQEQGQPIANGIQIGNNFFEKVSDSTLLPPTHRMKSNMEDIAKGLKIAGAIGGAAIKAAKTIQDTFQTAQGPQSTPVSKAPTQDANQQAHEYQVPSTSQDAETLFCDQCGTPARPGKRYCNHCGARLP